MVADQIFAFHREVQNIVDNFVRDVFSPLSLNSCMVSSMQHIQRWQMCQCSRFHRTLERWFKNFHPSTSPANMVKDTTFLFQTTLSFLRVLSLWTSFINITFNDLIGTMCILDTCMKCEYYARIHNRFNSYNKTI